jgi:hypothetical protein
MDNTTTLRWALGLFLFFSDGMKIGLLDFLFNVNHTVAAYVILALFADGMLTHYPHHLSMGPRKVIQRDLRINWRI